MADLSTETVLPFHQGSTRVYNYCGNNNMATAAPSPLASSVEKTNGAKLNRLLIDGRTKVLRNVFDNYLPPAKLATDLNTSY